MNQHLQQKPQTQVANVRDFLNRKDVQRQIIAALPKHLTPERMIRVITTAITNTPKLAECTRDSLIAAIVEATTLGLEPNTSLGEAYLIPYGKVAKLIIGYRGFIALARRSGEISFAVSELVYANDLFRLTLGTNRGIIHEPLLTGDRGEKIGVYSLITYKDGVTDFEYMTADDVEKIRKRSKASSDGPWVTDTNEMWRKTPMRRHAKRWPLSPEDAEKVAQDEYTDFGITAPGEHIPEPPAVITQEQRQALVELAKKNNVSTIPLSDLIKSFGFELLSHITVDMYDEVLAAIEKAGAVDGTPIAETEPEVPENVSEVGTDSEEYTILAELVGKLEARMEALGGIDNADESKDAGISPGQKARFRNRKNLTTEQAQRLLDELSK
jgi:recombinase, phage RecT family